MNRAALIHLAKMNAMAAVDQAADYADSIEEFRGNLLHTLEDNGVTDQIDIVCTLEAYLDAVVAFSL